MSTRSYSSRRRLVAATLVCMLLIFGGIGLAAHTVAREESEELFSARLATSARVLEALMAKQLEVATLARPLIVTLPPELEADTSNEPEAFGHRYETKVAFQVWRNDGTLLARSASAPDAALAPLRAGFSEHLVGATLWQVFVLRSGGIWVVTAEKDEVRQELADYIGMSIIAPLIVGGILMLAVVNFLLLRSMRPLSELASLIAARKPDSLEPVRLAETPTELAPIVVELNQLLDRIRAAFEREQRFINAAAHEIRTPIAAVQLHLENALHSSSEPERGNALASALAGARRTSKLAEQLLALGRISSRSDAYQQQRVTLGPLCGEVIGTMEPLLARRGQAIELDTRQECATWGEPSQLRRLLQNLIENASVHGAAHGEIQVRLARQGNCAVISVANDGVPIPTSEADKLFTPYYRLPGAAPGGHGLGLAIVKEIADQHQALVGIGRKPDGQGTVVEVLLPAL
ncbi:sensor histidine kinase [Massilia yuzhufengensis]|uniref:histidine kinase n=1 Tax=Massilia yuzhufengensis TaxID=1164594 RepID=A0A1I1RAF1_9BURK|nr:sensor histidine kinase [Massilia yuzhufengensis]SFD27370.1 two-component system, OmpR family, sensor histidine kinase QseC [Massilia yuzhufengensis]